MLLRALQQHALEPNPWRVLADDEALPVKGRVVIGLGRYLAERDTLAARPGLGVRVLPGDPFLDLGNGPQPPLIVVQFPSFTDGRGFSIIRALRRHLGFNGELRASGHILPDQYAFLLQCGVDTVEIENPAHLGTWVEAAQSLSLSYQHGYHPGPARSILEARQAARVT